MQASTIQSSLSEIALALLSSSPSARAAFLTTYSAHRTLAFSDPLLAPAGSITGLSRVLNLLAFEHLFKEHVELADVKWDEGTRVLTVDAKTTWALPGVGLLRLQSEGVTRVFFEGAPEAEAGAGKDKGGERLVVGRLEAGESTDVNLAALLPGVVAYPLALVLLLLLPPLSAALAHLTSLSSSLHKTASRRPSGPFAAVVNPVDTLSIALSLSAVSFLAVLDAGARVWADSVGKRGLVFHSALPHPHPHSNIAPRSSSSSHKRPSSSPPSSSLPKPKPKHARTQPVADERYPHHEKVTEGLSFASAIKAGVEGLDARVGDGGGGAARDGEGSNGAGERSNDGERYPHHEHVVGGLSFASATKSGVEGLDARVPSTSGSGGGAGEGSNSAGSHEDDQQQQQQQKQQEERYPHHEHVTPAVSFASATKSGVEGLDARVPSGAGADA